MTMRGPALYAACALASVALAGCGPAGGETDAEQVAAAPASGSAAPSFDCGSADDKAAAAVCAIPDLALLDTEVHRLYALAESGTYGTVERLEELAAMQRRWLERRDACGEGQDIEACLFGRYAMRIHELRQGFADARSQDARGISHGPLALACDGADYGVSLTYFDAVPAAFLQWEAETRTLRRSAGGEPVYRAGSGEDAVSLTFMPERKTARFTPPGEAEMSCTIEEIG